ncbi:glutaredoxin family protein [Gilvimarinus sp. SDUM040013]|uniref:Glutaredoxin family protein n=1 Tax=Gilvimarinus gilvus TaxID=3058038 RepID=A0ABU4S330_9GAMM|nr:glutaredoxin family protein [Gilvimarinus sp. SDUM040013]MDO3386403.1 glutaredoxin family protein [Gilvimarinus sp. SDUM040013]MDX6849669.1 glutaredoxin family protein [Gilvimarinus sp. SDUM040013]
MKTLIFFTTTGCHLCEQAKLVVASCPSVRLQEVDIACDEQLIDRYGLRIPVLRRPDLNELNWPFSAEDVIQFIGS